VAGHQSEPGSKVAFSAKSAVPDGSDGCGRDQQSHSRDLPQSPAGFILAGDPLDLLADGFNLAIQLSLLLPDTAEQMAHTRVRFGSPSSKIVGIWLQVRRSYIVARR
jgi:hypothetical protein